MNQEQGQGSIEVKIKNMLNEESWLDESTSNESKLKDDLGMDSLDIVEIVMKCEKEFNIKIEGPYEEEIAEGTIQTLIDRVTILVNE